jgi:N-acetylglucosaminyldiphosphoundecaprenol N-acetyl-beta-D-mannosaminyltransferase
MLQTGYPRFEVMGVGVNALSLEQACARIVAVAQEHTGGYVCCCTVHSIVEAQDDDSLRDAFAGAELATPDGMPLVWLGRWRGHKGITRVYGPDLMLAVCDEGRHAGLRHYFYGGAPGVAMEVAARMSLRFPGLLLAGSGTPPYGHMGDEQVDELGAALATIRPDVVWVGLGAPKQERFMARCKGRLACGVMVGVGAAFDFHSGRVRQAPRWMQRGGLEWAWRLFQEPRRLWRRYLVTIPRFVWGVATQAPRPKA